MDEEQGVFSMKNQKRRIYRNFHFVTAVAFLLCLFMGGVALAEENGSFSETLFWQLNDAQELTITGTGAVPDFADDYSDRPWANTVKKVTLDAGVESVGAYAFSDCEGLTQIILGSPETVLAENALPADCGLVCGEWQYIVNGHQATVTGWNGIDSTLQLPQTVAGMDVKGIGQRAFANCTHLADVEIHAGIALIGENAFENTGLQAVELEETTLLGNQAFDEHVAVTCGDYVYTIHGSEATVIAWLGSDTVLTVPDTLNGLTVTGFADAVFKNNKTLTEVTLPGATKELGEQLFYGCTGLTRADLGDEAETLSAQIFFGCRVLKNVTLPGALTRVEPYAFGNCVALAEVELPYGVTEIGVNAFRACAALVTAPLPGALEKIDAYAFYGCNSLTAVDIPDGVTSLGGNVFSGCTALTDVTVGKGLKTIEATTFAGLQSLKTLNVEGTDVSIASYAFKDCTALQTVEINDAVVGSYAFQNCSGLRTFSIKGGSFSGAAFSGCTLLKTLDIGSNVSSLPSNAFSNLPALETVYLRAPLAQVPYRAFENCVNLKTVQLNSSIKEIGSYAFNGCTSLTDITLPALAERIDTYAFANCTGLETVYLPWMLVTIDSYAFSGCEKLTDLSLNDGLTYINESAFAGCTALEAVTLPSTVTTVGKNAFPAIVRVYCNPTSPAAVSISANGGSFVSPENEIFGIRLLLDGDLSLGLSVEQIWTEESAVEIPEYIGGETVTELGKNVFASCPGVVKVTLPASVPVLPEAMLKGNATLHTVIIPEGVTGIGVSTFEDCAMLTSVSIPSTVTSIGANAFKGCELLKEVQLSDHIQEIGTDAFFNSKVFCSLDSDTARMLSRTGGGFVSSEYPLLKMKYLFVGGEAVSLEVIDAESSAASLVIPDSVTSIGERAFQDMKALTAITLPDALQSIGAYAFAGSGITSITLPEGVTRIADYTFYDTAALKEINILGTVETVGEYAFYQTGLKSIAFADGLKTIGRYAFNNTAALTSAQLPDTVIEMGDSVFQKSGITSFKVPAGMERIPYNAFRDCSYLEAVQVPKGVKNIEAYAFYNSGLASIELPDTVEVIQYYAFQNCIGLKKVTMSGRMKEIGYNAFEDCVNLAEVTMPDFLEILGYNAFRNCSALTAIILPEGLTELKDSTFNTASALMQVQLPEGILKIGDGAFSHCKSLTQLTLPSTLVEIDASAFSYSALKNLKIPKGVTTIGDQAFYGSKLQTIELPDTLIALGKGAFAYSEDLVSVRIPASLTVLPDSAFSSCTSLTSVTLPQGLRSIGSYTFGNANNLVSVLIPASVTSIDSMAFANVPAHQLSVYCYHNTEADTFAQNKGYTIVYLDGENVLEGFSIRAEEKEISLGLNHSMEDLASLFTILPEAAPYQATLVLSVEDEGIASLENGVVTGLAVGETKLVASLAENDEITASIALYIRENISDFTLPEEIWQPLDEQLTLMPASTVPAGANDGYRWALDVPVAEIDGNVLTPKAAGAATLTATSWNGVERTSSFYIFDDPTDVEFKNVPAGADVGTRITLEPHVHAGAEFTGKQANHFLTYTSSDDSIATVDAEGVVTTVNYGTAIITAVTENGVEGQAAIYVSAPIESFNLQGRILAPVGATIDLAATEVQPANANPNAFTWTCHPEGLVSYANGKVTVLTDQEAEVTITATSWDGALSKTTAMTIYRPQVESITFEPVDWVEPYSYVQLTAHVKAVNDFVNQLITWKVDDDQSGVSIDQNGLLYTGYSAYKQPITITATADNGISASMTVYVVHATSSFKVDDRIFLQTGATKQVETREVCYDSYNQLSSSYWRFSLDVANNALAAVEGMNLTGLKPGMTDVTVTSWNGTERTLKLLVYDPIEEIDVWVDEDQLPNPVYPTDLLVQKNYNMRSLAHSDQTYADDLLVWTSSDPTIIRVEDKEKGLVRTVNYGTATLTATAENGVSQSIELTVRKEVDTFTLPAVVQAYVLADKELTVASITPADAWDGFNWQVEPASLGTVEGNILHVAADKPTEGRLIAISWDGYVTKETRLEIIQEPVSAITIDPVGRMGTDNQVQLVAHVQAGVEYINRFVTFASSDDTVATVDQNGVVTGLNPGVVTITVTDEDGKVSAEIEIEVIRGVSDFTLPEKVYLQAGESLDVELKDIAPEDALHEFTWASENEDVLTVDGNHAAAKLTSVAESTEEVTVTVTSWNGVERSMIVSIHEPVSAIALSGMPVGMGPGTEVTLEAEVTAGGLFGKELVTFSSSDEKVATVDENGKVTAVDYGRANIIVRAESGVETIAVCRVTVPVEDFTLPVRFLAAAGTTLELSVNDIEPANADADAIEWTIEPAELGTINGNVFTAAMVDDLIGTVTATGWDGQVVKQAVLQVYKPQVTDITFDPVPTLWNGCEYQLTARVFADGTEFINELVTFSDNNNNVTVDENGVIYCNESSYAEYVTVTATAENGVTASVNIYIAYRVSDFTLEENVLIEKDATHAIEVSNVQGSHYPYTYKVDDSGVVSVDENGVLTGVKAGEAQVTVKAFSGLEKTMTVRVHDPVTQVTIDPVAENHRMITNVPLNVRVLAEKEYGDELVTWSTSNSRVASVNGEGLVKTLSYGEATITAAAKNGISASVLIRVAKEVTSFTLPEEFVSYVEYETALAASSITPPDAHATFNWTVTPAEIGTVENNVLYITATEPCEGTLTAVSWDGNVTREARIRILKEEVTDVALAMPEGEIVVGNDVQMAAAVTAGVVYENHFVTWAVSDETVASVDENGVLHPKAAGTVTVTATTDNGLSDEVELTVIQGVDSFDVPQSIFVYVGETAELTIENIQPENAEERSFEITVEPEGLVAIENGIIVPQKVEDGQGTITVTSWNGTSRTIALTVKVPAVESITLEPLPTLYSGKKFQLKATVVVDGETYVNRFVTFGSNHSEYLTLDPVTGEVELSSNTYGYTPTFYAGYYQKTDYGYENNFEYQSADSVEQALTSFDIVPLEETLWCGDTVSLEIRNCYPWGARTDVTWTAEPADAVSIEDNVLTVLTKEETTVTLTATSWCDVVRTTQFRTIKVDDIEDFTLPSRVLVPIGGEIELKMPTLEPADAGMQNFNFIVQPEGVVEIKDGIIKALVEEETSATLTVSSWNGITRSTRLQLYAPNVAKIEVQPITLWNNDQFQLHAKVWVDGVEYDNQFIKWEVLIDGGDSIDNYGWGSVSDKGLLYIYNSADFTATLIATADNGVTGTLDVRVINSYETIQLPDYVLIPEGQNILLRLESYEPEYYMPVMNPEQSYCNIWITLEDDTVVRMNEWTHYNDDAVSLTALRKGETTITATGINGVSDTARVIVYDEVDGVEIAPVEPQQIYKNTQLTATVTTDGISLENKLITWSTSDESIATVNSQGMMRTVGYGTVTITATAENGISDSVEVYVYEDTLSFRVPEDMEVAYGETLELYVTDFLPENGLNRVTWSVEPADAASIEGNILTPLKNEDVQLTVTATSWDGVQVSVPVNMRYVHILVKMYLPNALTVIEEEAFAHTIVEAVCVPSGCTTIEARAFADSEHLLQVHLTEGTTSIAANAFSGSNNVTIYAPEGSYAQQYAQQYSIPFVAE